MMGQTISQISYYTENGIYAFPVELYVPVKFDHTLETAGAAAAEGKTTLTMTGFPQDHEAVYTVTDPAGNASDMDFACYLASITSAKVNDTDYAAAGRGSVAVIDKGGKVNFSTTAFSELAGQTVTITITAQGYGEDLALTIKVPDTQPAAPTGAGH